MAKVERIEIFDVDINDLYKVIIDYESYPEFVPGVSEIEIVKFSKTKAEIAYIVNMMKKFEYTLSMKQKSPKEVSWEMKSGDLFKKNSGYWKLKDLGDGETEVTYCLDVEFKFSVPKLIANKMVKTNMPATMEAFVDRANEE